MNDIDRCETLRMRASKNNNYQLGVTYYISDTVLSTLYICTYLVLAISQGSLPNFLHLTDEETDS